MSINIPYEQRYLEIEGNRMHYFDEGTGPVILFAHGIPEWSMSYAKMIAELSGRFRCIVPDHIGFGLSDKPKDIELGPKAHARRLLAFLEKLSLQDIHLVVHDLGGPIGIGALVSQPGLFSSLSISNSFLWSLQGTAAGSGLKMMQGAIGKWLYLNYGFSVKVMAKNGFADKRDFEEAKPMLIHPHHTKQDRYANYQLMLEMLNSGAWYNQCLKQLKQLDIPMQLIWGRKDKFFTEKEYLQRWKQELPHARVQLLENSGHFPQLEAAKEYAEAIQAGIAVPAQSK